jgi:1,4-dihydroxy-2-naphthoate octaprenyltransferase
MIALWIEAARPKTLAACLAPVLIASALAYPGISMVTFLFTLLTAISIQVGTNYANDYFDCLKGADTPDRKGPRRITAAGLVSHSSMKLAVFLTFSTTALLSSYLIFQGGPIFGLLTTVAILLGIGYTAGPFPLAYLGLGDLFVLVFFGPVATLGAYYLQSHSWDISVAILGLAPGLISTAILAVNNLRDIEEDRQSRKKTLCVRFGATFGKVEYTLCLIGAAVIPAFYGYYFPLLILIPAVIPLKTVWKIREKKQLNATLAQTGKLLLLFTLLFIINAI